MPTSKPRYEYIGDGKNKGGIYEIIVDSSEHDTIICAGTLKHSQVIMYKDVNTHQVYLREKSDFKRQMKKIV